MIKRTTILVLLVTASCSSGGGNASSTSGSGGGSSGSSSSSGSGGSSGGGGIDAGATVLGGSLAFADAQAADLGVLLSDGGRGLSPSSVWVEVAHGPDACATQTADWVIFELDATDGGAVQPGHYEVATRQVTQPRLYVYDDAGNLRGQGEDATAGSVDLDSAGPPAAGRFDFTFPSGTLQGSFVAQPCP